MRRLVSIAVEFVGIVVLVMVILALFTYLVIEAVKHVPVQ